MPRSSQNFQAQPLIFLAASFMLGIAGAAFLPTAPQVLIFITAAFSVLTLVDVLRGGRLKASIFICLAYAGAGATHAVVDKQSPGADSLSVLLDQGAVLRGEPVELTGVLTRQPEAAPEAFYLTLHIEKLSWRGAEQRTTGSVSLLLPLSGNASRTEYDKLELRYGARIRTLTSLRRSETFRNPGGTSSTEYLERKGFAATALVKSPQLIERLDDERVLLPLAWLYDWRQRLQEAINTHFTPDTAGILNASVLGNHHFLSRSAAEKFREGGTFHVLVISGLHISFIGGLIFLIAGRVTKNKLIQFLLSATILWSYSLAVGAEASVIRAALMFTFVAFAPVVSRRAASLNALGAAALVLLCCRPRDLFDPSFQLTFLSVAAIVVFAWPLLQRMSEIGRWRPSRASPYPPHCRRWLRAFCEALFWSEKKWHLELTHLNYRCKLFKTPIAERLERFHLQAFLRYGFAAVLVSCCVQITMLPLLVVYFHRVSISGLVLNIGVSAIMAVLIFTGMAALLVAAVSASAAAPFINVTNLLQWLMVHSVDPFSRLGLASLRLPEYSAGSATVYVVFFVPLIILALTLPRWTPLARPHPPAIRFRSRLLVKFTALAQVLLVGIVLFHPLSAAQPDGRLRVDFLDVGQGDAALVTMPDGTTLLVDGGGQPKFLKKRSADETTETFAHAGRSIGEAVVSEYLWWRGVDQVDYVLATHADADHITGLNDVVRNFKVRAALVARIPANDPEFAEFLVSNNNAGVPLQVVGGGDTLSFGAVRITVLWPAALQNPQAPSANNDSLVLQIEYGSRKVLLLADIESKAEHSLLREARAALQADIVKVAHHGSRTSSTAGFVAAVHPNTAIISVGQQSMFGHPHREVVERWRAKGAEVLTTGQGGMITVTTDGRELTVTSFVPK